MKERRIRAVTPRTRKALAFLGIALVIVAGALPALSSALGSVILVALWLVLTAIIATVLRREESGSDEQPVALLCLLQSRAPPTPFSIT
jgi:peptidoglycan/LPS O-acetylase OafA/YrhL